MAFTLDTGEWLVVDKDGNDVTDEADELYDQLTEALELIRLESPTVLDENVPDINMRASLRKEAGLEAKTPFEHAVFYSEFDFELAVPPIATTTKFYFSQGVYPDGNVTDFVVTQQENGGFIHLFQSYIDENVPGV